MKRKSLVTIIICLISAMLLAGCGKQKSDERNLTDKLESVMEDIDAGSGDEEIFDTKPQNIDKETEEPGKSVIDLDFAGAFKEGRVYNNGNYFVMIGDKVYFRNISPDSMDEGAAFGEFLNTEYNTINCPLISYDINTCECEEIGIVAGTGELYACPQGFYIAETVPDMFDASCTNLYDPVKKEISYYCSGLPCGVSKSGEILAVDEVGGQNMDTVLYKDGKEIARLGGEMILYEYVGFAGETLITMLHTANDEYVLCSTDEEGNTTELGVIGNSDNGYGVPEQFRFLDGYVYASIGYYEGSGGSLSHWEVVKAKPGVSGSVEIVINDDDVPVTYEDVGYDPDVPIFFFDTGGAIDYSEHLPYDPYMGSGDKENDLLYYDDIFEERLLVRDFIDRSNYEKCSIIQDMESITDTAFIIYADAEADSEYDIGWRMGYRMTGWHICAIPFGYDHLDVDGLAKEIIYFTDEGVGKSGKSDKGRAAEDSDNAGDPLEGLVSNDILAAFRESSPVKNPESIEDEAYALGKWVQKSIKKIPSDIREEGEEIGRHHEFWFGTDVGNNFDDNFPRIYAAFYCLKDYYASDGKSSTDFYDSVMEEIEFFGGGGSENIEKMYTDMQEFITDCNNIIRNK